MNTWVIETVRKVISGVDMVCLINYQLLLRFYLLVF